MGQIKVFCSGCTEHIGIVDFLRKINPNNEYECFKLKSSCKKSVRNSIYKDSDNRLKVREDSSETVVECPILGKTGKALTEFAKHWVQTFVKRGSSYTGYIFSDDLDSNPFVKELSAEFIDKNYWDIVKKYDSNIRNEISEGLEGINIVILLAIPEIESWFLYSWDTAIKEYYIDEQLTDSLALYFKEKVFAEYCDKFEEWCSKKIYGKHCKISELLMKGFDDVQLFDEIEQNDITMPNMKYLGLETIKTRHQNGQIKSYNKKKDGPYILSLLDPCILEMNSKYLKSKFDLIREIS
jgi:hypothetical protein